LLTGIEISPIADDVQERLGHIVQRLIAQYRPERIILYGSLAWGQPHADSDIDLLIVKETDDSPLARRVAVRRLAAQPGQSVPFSPLVITPDELSQQLARNHPLYRRILSEGVVLYERV
jgi:predicted nucleotidyltransferase